MTEARAEAGNMFESNSIQKYVRRNIHWIFFLFVIAFTFLKRMTLLDPHLLSWDEVVYVTQAKEFVDRGVLLEFEPYRPPLWPFLLGLVFAIAGSSPLVIELFSWMMGVLLLLSFIPLYRRILDPKTADSSMLVTLSLPIIWLQIGGRVMSESLFLALGNVFLMTVLPKLLHDDEPFEFSIGEGILAGISLGLATLARFTAFLYVIPVIVLILAKKKKPRLDEGFIFSVFSFLGVISFLFILSIANTGTPIGFFVQYSQANRIDPSFSIEWWQPIFMSVLVAGYLFVASSPLTILGTIRGILQKNPKDIMLVLWFSVPLLLQGLLRIDYYHMDYFDLGSGGLFVRLTFPWIVGGIILACRELGGYRNRKRLFLAFSATIVLVNCSFAGVVVSEYRTSTYYQELREVREILDNTWDKEAPLVTNWIVII
jgi:4-amino-4-deoxy-L-arabinose transferase-like glycosyltransferase